MKPIPTTLHRAKAIDVALEAATFGHVAEPPDLNHDHIDLNVPRPSGHWVLLAVIAVVILLGVLLFTGWIPRAKQAKELQGDAADAQNAPVIVNVVAPRRAAAETTITIPATLRPWQEVSIFARTTGYLKKYYIDISNDAKAGQLLADIDTPEVDQQLDQARAALEQNKAAVNKAITDRDLAKVTLNRFVSLKETHSVSLQDIDEKQAALNAAEATLESAKANVSAAEANVRQLEKLQSFEKVYAPFDGVCTGRAYDVGSLILANPTATDIKPLFKLAQNDILRAFVNVPQSAALQIRKGMDVKVTAREKPGRVFVGKVMGTTNYLDQANRTLLTEVKLDNPREPDGTFALLPGMYVQASFTVKRDTPPLIIPGPAIINNAQGTQVAILDDTGKVRYNKVTLGQDFGADVEIEGGLTGNEKIIANPGERTTEGASAVAAQAKL